jgi:hypothetical protein
MDCKEFEKMIPNFINRRLDYFELKAFKEHFDSCANCKEELVIQFLVTEGIQRLEDGDAFDLQKELDVRIADAERRLKIQDIVLNVGITLEIFAVLTVVAVMLWILV